MLIECAGPLLLISWCLALALLKAQTEQLALPLLQPQTNTLITLNHVYQNIFAEAGRALDS